MDPATDEFVQLSDDVRIHVVRTSPPSPSAPSPTLVFLHFWGGSAATWSGVTALLSERYPTVAIDFRGWGSSTGPDDRDAYSIIDLAKDVEAVLAKLNLATSDVVISGHSMGGKVAQAVAGRNNVPGLRGLVLVAPAPPTQLNIPEDIREQQRHAYDSEENADFVARNVLTAPDSGLSDEAFKAVVRDMLRGNEAAKFAWPMITLHEGIVNLARAINLPTLVIAGEKDVVEPPSRVESELMGTIQGAKMVIQEGTGHLMPIEKPTGLSEHITRFLGTINS
jgi:pimeloyl-ACP methyl ester carboxylesterase